MVKGITKQVVVVKSPDQKLFEQAIFLVKDSALSEGGITEEALLREARIICKTSEEPPTLLQRIMWTAFGACSVGIIWAFTALL